jgi:Glycosyl transferase family 2
MVMIPENRLLSVIVPTRGRSGKLAGVLDALGRMESTTRSAFEVIVVIDGDGEIPDRHDPFPLRVITSPHVGAGPARNLGIEHADGDAILILNDDVIPSPGFIDAHVGALNAGHPMVLGDSPWAIPSDPSVFDEFIAHTPAVFDRRSLVDGDRLGFRYGWTLNLSFRRSVLDRIGCPFNPDLRPVYFEDIEFAYRCMGSSDDIVFCSDARAVHAHRLSVQDYFSREVLLGMMSVVLEETNPACFQELFSLSTSEHAARCQPMLGVDLRDHRRALDRFVEIAADPQGSIDPMLLFDLHLPLKRRAFRLGLCAMNADLVPWQERVAMSTTILASDPVFDALTHAQALFNGRKLVETTE